MWVAYGHPRSEDNFGQDYQQAGRLNLDVLREHLPRLNMPYLLCAPPAMMQPISVALAGAGVDPATIRAESFGGSQRPADPPLDNIVPAQSLSTEKTITFARSEIVVPWHPDSASVLQFGRDQGVDISSGCEYGDCGTCMTRLVSGTVTYRYQPGARIDAGYCLPCVCRLETCIILDI